MYNWLNISGNIMMYGGLIGIGAGLAMMYIGTNYDVYVKSSNICIDCNNKNKENYSDNNNINDIDIDSDSDIDSDIDSDSDDSIASVDSIE